MIREGVGVGLCTSFCDECGYEDDHHANETEARGDAIKHAQETGHRTGASVSKIYTFEDDKH